jgi:hypothetical protein
MAFDNLQIRRAWVAALSCPPMWPNLPLGGRPMDAVATILLGALALYLAVGLVAGLAFVVFGVTAVQSAPATVGARILFLPGAVALWPIVLSRWLRSRSSP